MGAVLLPFRAEDAASEADPETLAEWFAAPPYGATDNPWIWLNPERSRELRRLVRHLERRFDLGGDWFSASRDRPERIDAFRDRVRRHADDDEAMYVIRKPDQGVYTTTNGFLSCWPRLRLEDWGYVVVPTTAAFYFRILHSGTAHIAALA